MAVSVQVPADVSAIIDNDGAVLLDLREGKYFSLNGVGAIIWKELTDGHAPAEIALHLSERFGVAEAACARDVDDFITRLRRERLLDARDA